MTTAGCRYAPALDAWERAGSRAAFPEELERHTECCAPCRERAADVRRVRALFSGSHAPALDPRRVQEMRFLLLAETRQRRSRREPPRGRSSPALASLALAALLAALALLFVRGEPERPASSGLELAQIHLAPGARGWPLSSGPDQAFALLDGSANFSVRSLRPGERFRVWVGGSLLEVRGTRFSARAEGGLLRAVDVSEGAVLVSHLGQSTLVAAGADWRAPAAGEGSIERPIEPALEPVTRAPKPPVAPRALAARAPAAGARPPARVSDEPDRPELVGASGNERFASARALLLAGHPTRAARQFAELSRDVSLDKPLRADAEYWTAECLRRSGDFDAARAAASRYLESAPDGWHAPHAALLVGEVLIERGQPASALPWLRQAAARGAPSTRKRAEQLAASIEAATR